MTMRMLVVLLGISILTGGCAIMPRREINKADLANTAEAGSIDKSASIIAELADKDQKLIGFASSKTQDDDIRNILGEVSADQGKIAAHATKIIGKAEHIIDNSDGKLVLPFGLKAAIAIVVGLIVFAAVAGVLSYLGLTPVVRALIRFIFSPVTGFMTKVSADMEALKDTSAHLANDSPTANGMFPQDIQDRMHRRSTN